jgi:hypothetical protein
MPRKKLKEKAERLTTLYVLPSRIEQLGGKEKLIEDIMTFIESKK